MAVDDRFHDRSRIWRRNLLRRFMIPLTKVFGSACGRCCRWRTLTARSTSLEEIGDERAASPDADALDHAGSGAVGAESAPAPALEEALRDRQAAVSLRCRRHGQAGGDKRSKGAT